MPFASNQRIWSATYCSVNFAHPPSPSARRVCSLAAPNPHQFCAFPPGCGWHVYERQASIAERSARQAWRSAAV